MELLGRVVAQRKKGSGWIKQLPLSLTNILTSAHQDRELLPDFSSALQDCPDLERVSKTLPENKPASGMDRLHLTQKILVQSPHSVQLKKIWLLSPKESQASLIITAQQCETLAYTASSTQQAVKKATKSTLLPGQYKGFAEQVLWRFIWQQSWQNGLAENIKGTQQSVQNNTFELILLLFFFKKKISSVINFSASRSENWIQWHYLRAVISRNLIPPMFLTYKWME